VVRPLTAGIVRHIALVDLDGNPRTVGPVDLGPYEFAGTALPSLVSPNLVQGMPATWTVRNAQPGEPVFLILNLAGVGAGPCIPALGICLGLLPPFWILPPLAADSGGVAKLTATLSLTLPTVGIHMQALLVRGSGSVVTNTVSNTVNAAP